MKLKSIPLLLLLPALMLLVGCGGGTSESDIEAIVDAKVKEALTALPLTATPTQVPTLVMPLPSPILYTVIDIYEVPIGGWSIFERVLSEQFSIPISFRPTGTFRSADVVYFLFNPPNATEHPNDEAFRIKFERWLPEHLVISKESTAKILEVSKTLTLWETGGQSALAEMSEEQIGHLRVFHPLYPQSYWNTPARCQESPVRNTSESFCRWRTLTQIAFIHPRVIIGSQKPAIDTIITHYRGQGKGYGEILAIAVAIMADRVMP